MKMKVSLISAVPVVAVALALFLAVGPVMADTTLSGLALKDGNGVLTCDCTAVFTSCKCIVVSPK